MYDFLLGGSHNFRADRDLARQMLRAQPQAAVWARANRSFLRRAVGVLLAAGVRQFLDLGSGLPTQGSVHEIVHRVDPSARVVYVDRDPVVVAYSQQRLAGLPHAGVVEADVRDPETILADPVTREVLDLSRPVGVLAVAVLHFVPDQDRPADLLAHLRDAVAAGSFLAISHLRTPNGMSAATAGVIERYNRTGTPLTLRSGRQVADLFAGWDLVEPGICPVNRWRPDPDDQPDEDSAPIWAGVARLAPIRHGRRPAAASADAAR